MARINKLRFEFPRYKFIHIAASESTERHKNAKAYLKSLPSEIAKLIDKNEEFFFRQIGFCYEGILESVSTKLAFIIGSRDLGNHWERLETDKPGKQS